MRTPIIAVKRVEIPYGSEVIKAANEAGSSILILGPAPESELPDGPLVELLTGPFGIGAVVPRSIGSDAESRISGRTDSDAATGPWCAVRARSLTTARIDPHEDDHVLVIRAALKAVRSAGLRVVSEPLWTAPAFERGQAGTAPAPEARVALSSILVITAAPDSQGARPEDRATRELVASLSKLVRYSQVTVLVTERGTDPSDIAAWRSQGVGVLDGPDAWSKASARTWASYSHVIMTASGARSGARHWVESTQPQAMKVLFVPSLGFRDVAALGPITPADELAGLELVRAATEGRVAELARWADVVWCENARDVAFIGGLLPGKPVVLVPPGITAVRQPVPLSDRRGVVMVADEGHDVIAGNEDAAVRALRDVVSQVRWRDPTLSCTVISGRPTPMLEAAARAAVATLVPSSRAGSVIGSARVVLAAHGYGTGQPAAIMASLAAGTPFVATPDAAGGLDLGDLAPISLFATDADLAARTWRLLCDDAEWSLVASRAAHLLSTRYGEMGRLEALGAALATIGITRGPPSQRWPAPPSNNPCRDPYWPVKVDLRPPGIPAPDEIDGPGPTGERARYQLWVERYGPTPATLSALADDLRGRRYRPRISVLMPVYNTDPDVLNAAVASVRDQIYDNWQLCIANDGSRRPETADVLDSLRGDPSISIIELPGSSGISAATNAALAGADGEFVTFLDHDDLLKPHALAQVVRWLDADPSLDVVYSDEDKIDDQGELYDPHIKPDWSPDLLMTQNYMCHLTVARTALVREFGGLRPEYDGSQDYDLVLRLTERTDRIAHIPEPLYSWRAVPGSAAADAEAKPYAIEAARRAVADALARRGYGDRVDTTDRVGCFRARYPIPGHPRVVIIIPTKDGVHLLRRCIESVLERSTYPNFEILVVDNQSTDGATLSYISNGPCRVIRYPERFNYARMMNYAARSADADALLFLNNDTEVMASEWIESLLEHAMRPEVGAVGGRLYFGNGEPQHEGIMVGVGGGWAHNLNHKGYWIRGELTRNVSAVTGACTMIRPSVYWRVGGNDERLRVAYNDVDLCLRIRQAGYQIVYTPFVELYHYESSSRGGYEHHEDGPLFGIRWHPKELGDSYYSPMFHIDRPFAIRN